MNIVQRQALKLVKERGFDVPEAVKIAYETQKERGFIRNGKLTQRGIGYGELTSEEREKVRREIAKGKNLNDFSFSNGKAIYIPNEE